MASESWLHTATDQPSVDDSGKEEIRKVPDLEVAQLFFLVGLSELHPQAKAEKWELFLQKVKENEMGPYYKFVCGELQIAVNETLLAELQAKNEKRIAEIEAEIVDAEENLGESEVRQARLRKSEYLCSIGDKNRAVSAFKETYEKTVGAGLRLDILFTLVRLGLFFLDHKLIIDNITKAKELVEEGGDWERKNSLRSYEGLHKMSIRDFKGAAVLFLEAVPTFSSLELISYEQLIFYTIICCTCALDRPDLRSKVINCNEIQEMLNGGGKGGELTVVRKYLEALYGCNYDKLLVLLAELESERIKQDRYLSHHFTFFSRTMRLRAYRQYLIPYKTVRLEMMAKDFGVSTAFIDKELHSFIAAGELHSRIDAVKGIIEVFNIDSKNLLYRSVIRDGDILLNRVQKLARIVNP